MKISNWIFTLLFLAGAAVQYNDPYALPWIAIYLVAAVFAALAARDKLPVKLASYFTVVCFLFFGYLVFREIRTGVLTWNGGMFEVIGVLILAVWTNLNVYSAKKNSGDSDS